MLIDSRLSPPDLKPHLLFGILGGPTGKCPSASGVALVRSIFPYKRLRSSPFVYLYLGACFCIYMHFAAFTDLHASGPGAACNNTTTHGFLAIIEANGGLLVPLRAAALAYSPFCPELGQNMGFGSASKEQLCARNSAGCLLRWH